MREIRTWTTKDSAALYNVAGWSSGYFRINEAGHVEVTPSGPDGPSVDLFDLTLDLGLASRNCTFSTDWTGKGSALTSVMSFTPIAQDDPSQGIEAISIDGPYEIPSWERVVMP